MTHCSSIILIIVGVISIATVDSAYQAQDEQSLEETVEHFNFCDGAYHSSYLQYTCCNRSLVINTIQNGQNSTYWKECQSIKSTGKETPLGAFWRVYTCVLSKFLPSGQLTISLAAFTNISIATYPEGIRTTIADLLKKVTTSSSEPWMTKEVNLSNYENINKIRAQYFDLEKQACGDRRPALMTYTTGEPWKRCNQTEELIHRDSTCCGDYTIPFTYDSFQHFDFSGCNQTMAKFYEKFNYDLLLEIECGFACYLVNKSLITVENVIDAKESELPNMEIFAKDLYPYLPPKAHTKMAKQALDLYNSTGVHTEMEIFLSLLRANDTGLEKRNDLTKCAVYGNIRHKLSASLDDGICTEE